MKYKEQNLHEEKEDESMTDSDTSGKQSGWDEEDAFVQCFKEIAGGTGNSMENVVKGKISEDKDVSLVELVEEVVRYLQLPFLAREKCPLKYWQDEDKLPALKQLASKFLSTPASSVYSERLYSEYGNVFEDKHSRMLPKLGEMLLFIHHNSRKLSV